MVILPGGEEEVSAALHKAVPAIVEAAILPYLVARRRPVLPSTRLPPLE